MAPDVSEFLETAKLLSRDDIADLAYQLLQVLDGEASADAATVESAWRADFRRRIDEIESGEVELVDGRQTLTMARAMRTARRAGQQHGVSTPKAAPVIMMRRPIVPSG